jgi:signal transduction histidine kinase
MTLDGDMLTVVAYRGPIPQADALQIAFSLHEARANREVIERQQPLVVANVNSGVPLARAIQDTAGESLNTTYSYVRSWIGVPLVAKDQVLGMVTLDHSEPEYYTARHAELAMAFAHQVAVAIENAGLYDETRRRAEEVQALFTVQQAITSRLDRGVVLQLIADAAQRLSATEQSAVYLLDGDELEIAVISGDVPKEVLGYRLPVMDSIAGLAIRTEEPVLVTDSRQDPRVHRRVADRVGARSFLIVPLVSGSGAIGTITVANKMAGSFGPDVEHLLTMLASSAVIGLENARLYSTEQERRQEAERRRQVAESLRDILTVLNSNRPLEKVLDQVVLQASRLLSAEAASIYRLQVEDELLTIEAARGLPDDYVAQMVVPLGGAAAGRAAMERQPVAVPDTRTADFRLSNVREELQEMLPRLRERYRALLGVPLIVKEDVYGAMVLYYGAPRPFQREEVELAQTFAEQAALAIETARLRAQAEQSAVLAERSRLARELHDAVTQTLFSASLIAEVLPRIWEANPEQGRRRLDELRELTRGALAEMRTLLVELRPSALVEADLGDLIQQLAESVTGRARLPVQVNIEGSGDLDPEVKIAFYRVAQEALNNVVKHAMATQAWVELWRQPMQMRLSVRDDGIGFDQSELSPDSLGLGIMRERLEAIDATLEIESETDQGTEIIALWQNEPDY